MTDRVLDAGVGIERDVPRRVIDQAGGQLSKARRGELRMALPVGLVYDPAGKRLALGYPTPASHTRSVGARVV